MITIVVIKWSRFPVLFRLEWWRHRFAHSAQISDQSTAGNFLMKYCIPDKNRQKTKQFLLCDFVRGRPKFLRQLNKRFVKFLGYVLPEWFRDNRFWQSQYSWWRIKHPEFWRYTVKHLSWSKSSKMYNFNEQTFVDMYTEIHVDITKILSKVALHVIMQKKPQSI